MKTINLSDEEIEELKECISHYINEYLSQDSDKEFREAEKILEGVYKKLGVKG